MKVDTAHEICGALKARGYSVASWATEHGFNARTVHYCINNFAPKTGVKPKRKLAKDIMNKLSKSLNAKKLRIEDE
ncbi:hypothetical protein [Vibrio scophthalmi]|uniref:Uncharacterized protein n=1 Tax=Vibrio scophthalmi TaxID=45658 RepID=A0A1E3WMG1_9VIBR|nr:hypothetical protein [Vibrio scophthalmi]ODS10960.1 hypothetical protein VSF3289_01221 [Vibrio scophthalmi]